MKTLLAILITARPQQWVKNILVFFGLLFSGRFTETQYIYASFSAFFSFIIVSAAVYIINDIKDKDTDKLHPEKKNRPIASGELSVPVAAFCAALFMFIGIYLSNSISPGFLVTIAVYLAVNVGYTLFLKNYVIVDVFLISSGYIIRVLAGVLAVDALPTIWFVVTIFFASLFIGFSKRRGELQKLGNNVAKAHRKNLEYCTIEFLDAAIFINAAIAIATYLLFIIALSKDHQLMIVTVPFIAFAVYRYIFLVFTDKHADSPETIILDKQLLINNIIWLILFVLTKLDYFGKGLQIFKLE